MKPSWITLNEPDRTALRTTMAFLNGRLQERATIDWAIRLKSNDTIKRLAVVELLESAYGRTVCDPWKSAWRLIEESWDSPETDEHGARNLYNVQQRLRVGERSRSLILAIVELVSPRLKIEPFSDWNPILRNPQKRPKRVNDLFFTHLRSARIVDQGELKLENITDHSFLVSLADALDSCIIRGLDIAQHLGKKEKGGDLPLPRLYRVYYVPTADRSLGENEPDEFHRGIAPSVKLLHAVVARLVPLDTITAIRIVRRWQLNTSPVHLRLWSALSTDPRITPSSAIGSFLLSLDDRQFWYLNDYPEIAELRAVRFGELESEVQTALTSRIRKCPPRNQWPRTADADRVKLAQRYCAVRELRRIEIAGGHLPARDKDWLNLHIDEFPDLIKMARRDEGFLGSPSVSWVPPIPDKRYDSLNGEERLNALEVALSSQRTGWDDAPIRCAKDWIAQPQSSILLLSDFESILDGGATQAKVWNRFGWAHSPTTRHEDDAIQRDLPRECTRVLSLLTKLSGETIRQAIDGISNWLYVWEKQVIIIPEGLDVWLKLWPIAVEATNATQSEKDEHVNAVMPSTDGETTDLEPLNTPVGKLLHVFLSSCPTVSPGDQVFLDGTSRRVMRNAIEDTLGAAASIVKYRLIQEMPYFLAADKPWTLTNLISPLLADSAEARILWRAVARQHLSSEVMAILGKEMSKRAVDSRLGRDTQRSLVFRVTIEYLHALKDQRDPLIVPADIQQMIRSLDDEVRAYAAESVQRFISEVSRPHEGEPSPPSPEQLFRSVGAPFLDQVWPKERLLTTPGVSRALADLPSTARGAFAEAVATIEPFLVPFECWSMLDYGFFREGEDNPTLSIIDNHVKAVALLQLLNSTIGTSEGAIIPLDLSEALEQVRKVSRRSASTPIFRRLATAARRQ